jgi:ABC-type Fe3+ transport system substrate-binding protein
MAQSAVLAGAMLMTAFGANAARAQDVDPALADAWTWAQKAMPGISYDILKGACAEGSLMIYSGTWPDATDNVVKHFKEHFPCVKDVQTFVTQTAPRRERFLSEMRANHNIADIIQDTDPGTLEDQAKQGILANYTITNDASFDPAIKHSGFWYPFRASTMGIAWNTDAVTDDEAKAFADWKGILDPKWKGRIGVADPASGGAAYLPWYVWPKILGADFMGKLKELQPRAFVSVNPTIAALASGDIDIYFGADDASLTPVWSQGAPLKWTLPSPGIGVPTGQAISAHAPHPNAARLYQEYTFTEEGYAAWQGIGGGPSTRIGFQDQRDVAKQDWYKSPTSLYDYDRTDATAQKDQVIATFKDVVGN